jgi:hypothetical protein
VRAVKIKTERRNVALLKERTKASRRSQGAVVRDLIDKHLVKKLKLSLYKRAKDLCGSVRGPKDLSTRPLTGYGG